MLSVDSNSLQQTNKFNGNGFLNKPTKLSIATQILGVFALTIVTGALMPRSPMEKHNDTKKEEGPIAPQTVSKKD